jgi:4-hydroxy-tetrahydrodipicolinate synthase
MWTVPKGVMQAPVLPLTDDFQIDYDAYERLVDFHVRHGNPTAICILYHKSEPYNISVAERKKLCEVAVKAIAGRLPLLVHVTMPGTEQTIDLARHAQQAGATAVVAMPPYHWRLSQDAIYEHFVKLGTAIDIPFMGYNSPHAMEGIGFSTETLARLIERLPNFVGLKEASMDFEHFTEFCRVAFALRPDFGFIAGVEYLLSTTVVGGSGSFSACGGVTPNLVAKLWNACASQDYDTAQTLQLKASRMYYLFHDYYPSSLKAAMAIMGRPVGPTSLPLPTATPEKVRQLESQLRELGVMEDEPYGW